MNLEQLRKHCLLKKSASEDFPFDQSTLVFRVVGKIFAITDVDHPEFVNLKADPEMSAEWRERYEGIRPGYHMNKKLWNSVYLDGSVPDKQIKLMIDHSYDQVVMKLTKKERLKLK